jgi:hypothetical protein
MKKILIAMMLLLPLLAGCASDLGWVQNTVKSTVRAQ